MECSLIPVTSAYGLRWNFYVDWQEDFFIFRYLTIFRRRFFLFSHQKPKLSPKQVQQKTQIHIDKCIPENRNTGDEFWIYSRTQEQEDRVPNCLFYHEQIGVDWESFVATYNKSGNRLFKLHHELKTSNSIDMAHTTMGCFSSHLCKNIRKGLRECKRDNHCLHQIIQHHIIQHHIIQHTDAANNAKRAMNCLAICSLSCKS